jgi:membrane protein
MAAEHFQWNHLFSLLKESYTGWNDNDPFRMSAAMSYYAIFSLPGLLLIVVSVAGFIFGEEAVQGEISNQISNMIGPDAAKSVEDMVASVHQNESSVWATIIGAATLIFGATGVFYQLQQSLNIIWEVQVKKEEGIKKLLIDRITSFGVILAIGFLMLISLVLTAGLSALSDFIMENLPSYLIYVFYIAEFLVSYGIITLLFATIYKVLPDVNIEWKTVWVGAAVTAALFVIGKFALGIYFGKSDPASAYGAAGSLILILLWVSYSCLILFFGAEFTQVYARRYGHSIEPTSHARRTASYILEHQDKQAAKEK